MADSAKGTRAVRTVIRDLDVAAWGLVGVAFLALEKVIRATTELLFRDYPGRVSIAEDDVLVSLRMYSLYILDACYGLRSVGFDMGDLPRALPLPNGIVRVLDLMASYRSSLARLPADRTITGDCAGWALPWTRVPSRTLDADWVVWRNELVLQLPETLLAISRSLRCSVVADHCPGRLPGVIWSYLDSNNTFLVTFPDEFDINTALLLHCEDNGTWLDYWRFVGGGVPSSATTRVSFSPLGEESGVPVDPAQFVQYMQDSLLDEDFESCEPREAESPSESRPPYSSRAVMRWSAYKGWLPVHLTKAATLTRPDGFRFDKRVLSDMQNAIRLGQSDISAMAVFRRSPSLTVGPLQGVVERGVSHVTRVVEFLSGVGLSFQNAHYVDYGCGDMSITVSFADVFRFPPSRVTGVDVRKPPVIPSGFGFSMVDGKGYGFVTPGTISVVTAFNVFHHTPYLYEVLSHLRQNMSDKSYLLVKEHAVDNDEQATFLDIVHLFHSLAWGAVEELDSWISYKSLASWLALFRLVGFDVVKVSADTEISESPFRGFYALLRPNPSFVLPFRAFLVQ